MRAQSAAMPYFATSAVFHYLGPSFAVLLFARVDVLGVAWLRIASAAVVLAIWRRPWRHVRLTDPGLWWWGGVLAVMNSSFYLAVDRLPLATVGAIEFLGVVGLAAAGVRSRRNGVALAFVVAGAAVLSDIRIIDEPIGFAYALANCALFVAYVVLGHRVSGADDRVDVLAAAMIVAAVVATPIGIVDAAPAFAHPWWLLAGVGVGVCSSVIPYVADQAAMARLPRATFALMLSVLPASATVVGVVILSQLPTPQDLAGITLVIAGLATHQVRAGRETRSPQPSRR